jgi:hypothetical protein
MTLQLICHLPCSFRLAPLLRAATQQNHPMQAEKYLLQALRLARAMQVLSRRFMHESAGLVGNIDPRGL